MDGFLGEIRLFAGPYAPVGWNFCDGSTLPISGNEGLYSLIGITYGGDGISTFGLPNLKGRTPVSTGVISGGTNNYALAQTGGTSAVAITDATMPVHNHTLTASTAAATTGVPTGAVLAQTNGTGGTYPDVQFYNASTPGGTLDTATVSSMGGGSTHNNLMPYIIINFIICLQGNYPVRP